MSTCLTVVYDRPTDLTGFVRRYREEHIPLAVELLEPHGLRRWAICQPGAVLDNSAATTGLIATLWFDAGVDDVAAALGSAAGEQLLRHAQGLTDAPMRSYLGEGEEGA